MKNIPFILFFGLMPFFTHAQTGFQCGTTAVYADRDTSEIPWYGNNQILYEYLQKNSKLLIDVNHIEERGDGECPEIEGPCSKRPVAAYVKLENDTNVNFEFLKQSPDLSQANTTRKRFDEYAGFCFYVR